MAGPAAHTSSPTADELEEALSGIGLTSTERRAYRFLLESGPSTPTQVAAATRQSRGRIYETLRLLVERGLAREEPSRPLRYLAAAPEEAIRVALAQAERQSVLLRRAYGSLSRAAAAAPAAGPRTRATDVAVLFGRKAVFEEVRRLCEAARQYVHLEGGGRFAERVASHAGLVQALRDAARRRVRVRIHLPTNAPAQGRKRLEEQVGAASVQTLPPALATGLNYALTDAAAIYVHPHPDDASPAAGADVGFRAAGSPFVADLLQRYDPATVPTDGGRVAPSAAAGTPDVAAAFARALEAARNQVLAFDASAFEPPLTPNAAQALERLRRARQRGADLRLLSTSESAQVARAAGDPWDVRLVAWTPSPVVLVDGRELFQVVRDEDRKRPPLLRATREPNELRFYLELFERLWQQATPPA
jgi:sugar-specific transcriptional regulator TrmB